MYFHPDWGPATSLRKMKMTYEIPPLVSRNAGIHILPAEWIDINAEECCTKQIPTLDAYPRCDSEGLISPSFCQLADIGDFDELR